jgi:hypothetical protein
LRRGEHCGLANRAKKTDCQNVAHLLPFRLNRKHSSNSRARSEFLAAPSDCHASRGGRHASASDRDLLIVFDRRAQNCRDRNGAAIVDDNERLRAVRCGAGLDCGRLALERMRAGKEGDLD